MLPTELQEEDRRRLEVARWAPTVGPFIAFDRSWSVVTDDPDLAILIADLFADMCSAGTKADEHATFRVITEQSPRSLVARDTLRVGGGRSRSITMDLLIWGINRWVLDDASRDRLLLHAGGVTREDGLAVLLPAPSESGKSTLTTGLLQHGFAYLSDEAVAISSDKTVKGYMKPLTIDHGAWPVLEMHRPDATDPGSVYLERQWHIRGSRISSAKPEGRLGAVIFPRYSPKDLPLIDLVSPAEALVLATASTFGSTEDRQVPLQQVHRLAAALSGVPAYRLVSNDLDWSCRSISTVLDNLD